MEPLSRNQNPFIETKAAPHRASEPDTPVEPPRLKPAAATRLRRKRKVLLDFLPWYHRPTHTDLCCGKTAAVTMVTGPGQAQSLLWSKGAALRRVSRNIWTTQTPEPLNPDPDRGTGPAADMKELQGEMNTNRKCHHLLTTTEPQLPLRPGNQSG